MQITTIGLDLAKHVFQVHGVDANEAVEVLAKAIVRIVEEGYGFWRHQDSGILCDCLFEAIRVDQSGTEYGSVIVVEAPTDDRSARVVTIEQQVHASHLHVVE